MDNVFEQKNSFRVYIGLALPLVLSQLISMIYNIADTYFISYAQDAMLVAGVSLCAPILTMLMALGNLFGIGGSSLISRLIGQNDKEGVKRACAFACYAGVVFGVIVAVLLVVFRIPMLHILGADDMTIQSAMPYYLVLVSGSPFIVLTFIPTNLLRSEGLSKESMYASLMGTIINLILDPILIFGLRWGAFGAGVATMVGYIITDLYCVYIIIKKSKNFTLSPAYARCSMDSVKQILAVGGASASMSILMSISQMCYNQALLVYGNEKIASMGIAFKIYYVPFMICVGFSFGAQPIIGYFYGSRQYDRLQKILRQIFTFLVILAIVMTVIVLVTAPLTVPRFLKDQSIVADGKQMLFWQAITMVFSAVVLMVTVIFQSIGKAKFAFILSLTRQGILFIVILAICRVAFGYMGVITSQSISNVASGLIALLLLYISRKDLMPQAE